MESSNKSSLSAILRRNVWRFVLLFVLVWVYIFVSVYILVPNKDAGLYQSSLGYIFLSFLIITNLLLACSSVFMPEYLSYKLRSKKIGLIVIIINLIAIVGFNGFWFIVANNPHENIWFYVLNATYFAIVDIIAVASYKKLQVKEPIACFNVGQSKYLSDYGKLLKMKAAQKEIKNIVFKLERSTWWLLLPLIAASITTTFVASYEIELYIALAFFFLVYFNKIIRPTRPQVFLYSLFAGLVLLIVGIFHMQEHLLMGVNLENEALSYSFVMLLLISTLVFVYYVYYRIAVIEYDLVFEKCRK